MTSLDREVVRRKLAHIAETLEALRPLARLTLTEYLDRLYERKAAERLLQVAIEAAVDVSTHLVVGLGRPAPVDAYGSVVALGLAGVLERDLAARLAPATGLRNRLVHEYDGLDDQKVYEALAAALDDLTAFVVQVERFVEGSSPG
jgi:uncharacterized protein YutE (UPF0331/DUF86 family)